MEQNQDLDSVLRSSENEVLADYEIVALQKLFSGIFDAMTGISAILNRNRQIIYTNYEYIATLGLRDLQPLLGKRPGETLACMNSIDGPDGCGTSHNCKFCGILHSITECQQTGQRVIRETSIATFLYGEEKQWDLRVTCTPIIIEGHEFYSVSLQDISAEKRLASLERIFFHDILNTASGLYGLLNVLKEKADPVEAGELLNYSEEASKTIIDEISMFRQLRAAENGELKVDKKIIDSLDLLNSVAVLNSYHSSGKQVNVETDRHSESRLIETDPTILQRVLTNLIKNAVEASKPGNSVIVAVKSVSEGAEFIVQNPGVMSTEIQSQIFKRSFSTKGSARGIGTYSIKLLTERYLKGTVSFTSNESDGTVFRVGIKSLYPDQ
jgi:signal transduction histidine kinase